MAAVALVQLAAAEYLCDARLVAAVLIRPVVREPREICECVLRPFPFARAELAEALAA
jgi:hypothetical protein